jgi:hypothetical protein
MAVSGYEEKCQNLQSDRDKAMRIGYTSPIPTLNPNSFSHYLYCIDYRVTRYPTTSARFRYSIPYTNTISYRHLPRLTPRLGVLNGSSPALNLALQQINE